VPLIVKGAGTYSLLSLSTHGKIFKFTNTYRISFNSDLTGKALASNLPLLPLLLTAQHGAGCIAK
jgi:hypothetical protein